MAKAALETKCQPLGEIHHWARPPRALPFPLLPWYELHLFLPRFANTGWICQTQGLWLPFFSLVCRFHLYFCERNTGICFEFFRFILNLLVLLSSLIWAQILANTKIVFRDLSRMREDKNLMKSRVFSYVFVLWTLSFKCGIRAVVL